MIKDERIEELIDQDTAEEAEFAHKHQNITRTETLSLPTYNEILEIKEFEFKLNDETITISYNETLNILRLYALDSDILLVRDGNKIKIDEVFENTLENYLTICEICRKLFIGE